MKSAGVRVACPETWGRIDRLTYKQDLSMPIQLTPEQEQRIQAIVDAGAYPSASEALDAAVVAVEIVAAVRFEGSGPELEELLLRGVVSPELSEVDFWDSVDRETDAILDRTSTPPA